MRTCEITTKGMKITRLPTLKVYRENSRNFGLHFNDIDITGSTIYFTVKKVPDTDSDDENAVIKKDIITHDDPVNGYSKIRLTTTDTDEEPGEYEYDIVLVQADGRRTTIGVGKFVIAPGTTNRG